MLLAVCSPALRGQAAEPPARSVLLLQSYQQGPVWVQNINDGVLSVFAQSPDFRFNYRFEYMNILDADPSGYPEIYRWRLARRRFDILIAADNQALEFLVGNRAELFAGVPIVFCSVDDFTPDVLKGEKDITGVTGDLDFEGTIGLARRLHPGMKHLLVLANRNLAMESAAYARLSRLVHDNKLGDQIQIEYWEDPKLSEVIQKAGTFAPDTVVFDMAFLADDAGRPLGVLSSTRQASEALGLPIYSCWETLLGNGIVGGLISGGFQQGEAAGELALQVLRGADADSLPVAQEGTNRPMFDHAQLKRFRIPERRLPRDSTVINRPSSLYTRYRGVFWAFVAVTAALVALLTLSSLYNVNQQRLKRRMRRSEERLSLALAAAASGIWEYYPKTKKAYYDPRWFTMLGYEPGALPPEYKSWADLLHPDDRARTEQTVHRHVVEGKDYTLEFRMRSRDGQWRWISSSGKIVERDSAGSALRIVGTHVDVSERKRTQAELEQAYQSLERRVEERTRELAALNALAAVVSRSLDLGEIMESALQKTLEAAGVEAGAAYWLEEQSRTLVLMTHRGLSERFVSQTSRLPLEVALAGKQFDLEQPVVWSLAEYPEGELKSQKETLDFIIRQTCRVTGSDAASLLQRESLDGPFTIQSACGLDADYISAIRFSAGKGGAGRSLAARGPVMVTDATAFVDRFAREPDPQFAEEKKALELMISRGFSALLSVPLIIKNEDYGGITLYYRRAREFSQEEIQVAMSVADQAALAIENARLRGQAEQAAAFAERSRLARELHDSVTQSLYSITLYSEAIARMLASGAGSEAVEHLRELRATAQEALREMRLLIFQLSPPALDKGGLAGALQMRLDAVEARGGLKVDLRVQGSERLTPFVRQELYQIAQEALNNALKHARAQAVRVLIDFQESGTRLEVSDDGSGFDPEQANRGGGLGLRGMRERAQAIGGTLTVESSPGKGTTVRVTVPADQAAR